ncbi:STAS domain-containing protein [Streptomyces sp. NPDC057280]|uniref:STAS domain-containing protein n=1 Tax=Streptomyces sp. NPDC057280 TaxID=3346081 RepID=UPI00362BE14F
MTGEDVPLTPGPSPERRAPAVVQYGLGDVWVIAVSGEFDHHTSAALAEALQTAARKHQRVVVDAAGVAFADSMFLTLLLNIHGQTDLRVAAPSPQVARILELTGADTVLPVRPTVAEAAAD